MRAATSPAERPRDARLLVVDRCGRIDDRSRATLDMLPRRGDCVIANDAATLPASLAGVHLRSDAPIEVRLAGRASLDGHAVSCFSAFVFGAGDFHTPTEARAAPPALRMGDRLAFGTALRATVVRMHGHARFVELRFDGDSARIWQAIAAHGRPVQYEHVPDALALWDTWTPFAAQPVAFEPPSAGFALDWRMLDAWRARGVAFATLTHAAGLSSTGDAALDRLLPLDEPYRIPAATAALIEATHARRGRVIAVGTTVVRALEHAASRDGNDGHVRAGHGIATQRIGPRTTLRVVDVLLSGTHEPDTSHYELLHAFTDRATLARITAALERHDYRTHEFGDSVWLERSVPRSIRAMQDCGCDDARDDEAATAPVA
ncbi:S-adenosylmethionine:tRNA ribosyltransferase-isomerase [Paraburkholderia phosphatilytica]|uniref:S-adenosylmethionine:tRNA ribosyltransferase-isomerase n=1 Tax=Paraburkholderia phosphatilytica TaxID=2282883 RepID=UPI000E50CCF6|nr:S-adenosylmethionine:tRNA ribosyltransferase-isomerase [Paraburkholderia phosphatilytica]